MEKSPTLLATCYTWKLATSYGLVAKELATSQGSYGKHCCREIWP